MLEMTVRWLAAHNRSSPADIRGARNALTTTALDALKSKTRTAKLPPPKTSKTRKPPAKTNTQVENQEESYHFIGYVPAFGKVWELARLISYLQCSGIDPGWSNLGRAQEWTTRGWRVGRSDIYTGLDEYRAACYQDENAEIRWRCRRR
jgi:Ubiquitin carboxyl-terminal hydrolase, family 1